MSKSKEDFPSEFHSEWHYEAHLADLEREVAGCERRLLELKDLPNADIARAEAESGLEAARAELARLGKRKRPARAKETR